MPVLILISLSYILFWAVTLAEYLRSRDLAWKLSFTEVFFTSEGMFGLTAQISSTFVFMFIIFGSFLLRSGAGDFIVRLAQCLAGRFTGGAGLNCCCWFWIMGYIRISRCKYSFDWCYNDSNDEKICFQGQFSAGVVAAASTGGALMPPVMGAGAFVLASYTQISYLTIIAASALPAILYFLTVSYFIESKQSD